MKAGCRSARDPFARQSYWTQCKCNRLNRGGSPPRAGGQWRRSNHLNSCGMLLKKVLLLMQVLNVHGSVHSDPLKKYLSAGTNHWASDAVPCASRDAAIRCLPPSPAVLSGMLCGGRSVHTVQPSLAGKCRRREVQCLALGVGKAPVWGGGCSEGDSMAKLPFVRVNCKNEPSRTATVDHFIYCLCAAGHNRGHWSLLPFIPISDPGSSHLPHRPYTGAWTHPLHLHVVL